MFSDIQSTELKTGEISQNHVVKRTESNNAGVTPRRTDFENKLSCNCFTAETNELLKFTKTCLHTTKMLIRAEIRHGEVLSVRIVPVTVHCMTSHVIYAPAH